MRFLIARAIALTLFVGCGYDTVHALRSDNEQPTTRDKLTWPFAITSIWNTPVGLGAVYKPVSWTPIGWLGLNVSHFIVTSAADPRRALIAPGTRPNGECTSNTAPQTQIIMPDNFVLSAAANNDPANPTSILQPDGHTLVEVAGLARCQTAGPVFGFLYPGDDILGAGIAGAEGGSALSALGGALRVGEMTNTIPIRHALKIAIWALPYLYYNGAADSCRRWPATRCDAAASQPAPNGYHGPDPSLVLGSLLALPASLTTHQLGLTTAPGFKLFHVLQDFGAYVTGTSGVDGVLFGMEDHAVTDFQTVTGHGFGDASDPFFADASALVSALQIVDNNGPMSIGGGGTPRVPLAPPLAP